MMMIVVVLQVKAVLFMKPSWVKWKVEVTTITKQRRRRGIESALLLMKEQEANYNYENIISNLQPELNQDDRAGSDDEEQREANSNICR